MIDHWGSSAWFDWRKFYRQMNITQMENQRVELISKRNLRNHLRDAQNIPTPPVKLIARSVRPVARNNTRS